jgi:GNAT superfamily N-acetyltransferase
VKDLVALQDYKMIFAEAFRKTLEETEEKFWFCDEILLNAEDTHLNAFVLYENGTPATAGAYYAFDYFSVENIGTRPPFSWKGYAASIVKKLLQEAGKLGYQQACLVASEEGSRVYEKIGFTTLRETVTFVAPL